MDWRERIVTTPDTLFGKARILENYPQLKPEDLQAVFAFMRDCMKDMAFLARPESAGADHST